MQQKGEGCVEEREEKCDDLIRLGGTNRFFFEKKNFVFRSFYIDSIVQDFSFFSSSSSMLLFCIKPDFCLSEARQMPQ
jgi:hypothetical protein